MGSLFRHKHLFEMKTRGLFSETSLLGMLLFLLRHLFFGDEPHIHHGFFGRGSLAFWHFWFLRSGAEAGVELALADLEDFFFGLERRGVASVGCLWQEEKRVAWAILVIFIGKDQLSLDSSMAIFGNF